MLRKKRLGNLRSEVAEINAKRITSGLLDIFERLYHVDLTLHDTDRTLINIRRIILLCVGVDQRFSAIDRKRLRKAVAADCNDSDLHLWNVLHVHSKNPSCLYYVKI